MKKGTKITWTRRNGEWATGKVLDTLTGGRGDYLLIDVTGVNGKSVGTQAKIRPSQAIRA